jgi:DNA-directed RNA polymerase
MLQAHKEYEEFKKEAPGYVYTIEKHNRWASQSHRRATLLRAKKKLMGKDSISSSDRVHIGMICIDTFIKATGLVEKLLIHHPTRRRSNYCLIATDATQEWLDKAHQECELLQPISFPMIMEPVDWDAPVGGGFLSNQHSLQLPLVKTRNTKELLKLGDEDLSQVYQSINTLQRTAWRINKHVMTAMIDTWNIGGVAGLPSRDLPPIPEKPWEADVNPTKEQLSEWKASATSIYERHARERSKRIAMEIKLYIAKKFAEEAAIYFVWQMDWRGRVYPVQQFVNPQVDDSGRALLEFTEGKPLGEDGAFWLAVHGANCFGYDKTSFEERVQWVIDHEEEILQCAADPMGHLCFWDNADSQFQFLAFCFEWAGYKAEGESYVSHLPVSLDGSCNGLQNFSAMLRDEVGGKATNLVPNEVPSDIYHEVATVLDKYVRDDAADGEPLAQAWIGKIDRRITKRGVMTTPYGVTRYGLRKQLQFEVEKIDKEYLKVEDTGSHYNYLANKLYEAIGDVVIAARQAMAWLQEVATVAAQAGKVIRWTTPIGFRPCQEYRRQKLLRVDTVFGGIRVVLGIWQDTPKLDKRRMQYGIAPNFVHSLDASHLMSTINKCSTCFGIKNFSTIHDSFGTLSADASKLAYCIREAFVEQYSADVLENFRDEVIQQLPTRLADQIPPTPTKGALNLEEVTESRYFFA